MNNYRKSKKTYKLGMVISINIKYLNKKVEEPGKDKTVASYD